MTTALFDRSPCGYFSFFDDGVVFTVNQTLCDLLHYKKEGVEGKSVESIFPLPTRIFYHTHFFPLVKMQGHAEEIFLFLLTKNGEHLPVLMNAKREEGDKPFTACSFIVVANRKKFEDELIAARKEAETALQENTALLQAKAELQQRAEELDAQVHRVNQQNHELKQLNHVLTHNLKEPLRKIMVYTEKLGKQTVPAGAADDLTKLTKASLQMRNVVAGLQQYVWLNDMPTKFTTVDLNLVLKEAVEKIKAEAGDDKLQVQAGALPSLSADADQVELLFYHLLSNAVQFKKENKARVAVAASILKRNRFENVEGKYQYDDFVKLTFADEGTGFDPAFAETVFELFKKFHPTGGTGLGLALCKKITAKHFGFIKAESQLNAGTVITVTLPLRQMFSAFPQAGAEA